MPDHLIKATLATEDRRFYDHFGIDVLGTFRALVDQRAGRRRRQGGSSITQQLAKNLFLSNRAHHRAQDQGGVPLDLARVALTKDEILKLYLDRAYMGGGTFGVDGAPHSISASRSATSTLPRRRCSRASSRRRANTRPHVNLPAARGRANQVLDNMVDAGFMTEGQVFGARRHPATSSTGTTQRSPNYFLDYAFDEVQDRRTFPIQSSFVVRTTVDMNCSARPRMREADLRQYGDDYQVTQAAVVSPTRTAASAPWSAASTMARASSTAPSTRSGSRARRSSPLSTPPR